MQIRFSFVIHQFNEINKSVHRSCSCYSVRLEKVLCNCTLELSVTDSGNLLDMILKTNMSVVRHLWDDFLRSAFSHKLACRTLNCCWLPESELTTNSNSLLWFTQGPVTKENLRKIMIKKTTKKGKKIVWKTKVIN